MIKLQTYPGNEKEVLDASRILSEQDWFFLPLAYTDGSMLMKPPSDEDKKMLDSIRKEKGEKPKWEK